MKLGRVGEPGFAYVIWRRWPERPSRPRPWWNRSRRAGKFRQATLYVGQATDERSLLALRVNGADLSPDHGFPARVVVPAMPGVHNTKWVSRMTFA